MDKLQFNEEHAYRFLNKFKKNGTIMLITDSDIDIIGYNILLERDLIEQVGNNQFTITPKGNKVLRLGGWNAYLNYLEQKDIKESKKEEFDFKISKFQANNGLFPYYVSGIGLVISILTFAKGCKPKQIQQNQIQESETIEIINKKLDSFQNIYVHGQPLEKEDSTKASIKTELDSKQN